jgi:hypothetical protein
MAGRWHSLGPGTLTLGTAPADFSCEVTAAAVTHKYAEVGSRRQTLCDEVREPTKVRSDGFKAKLENDLSAAGLYSYALAHDLETVPITFVPNTSDGAEWAGDVVVSLPAEIGGSAFGEPIVSDIEWTAAGPLAFTPAGAAP